MLLHTTSIRVRYADTDKMQFVYNGKYFEYFEVGRAELLRDAGLPYSILEESGYQLPLIETGIKFKTPSHYDDILLVTAVVKELYTAKVHVEYEVKRESDNLLIVTGFTTHVFINSETKKPIKPPKIYIDSLKKYF